MLSRLLTFRLAALCLFVGAALPAGAFAQGGDDWNRPETYRRAQEYMLQRINEARAKNGAQSVTLDLPAAQAAKQHAEDMLARDYFSHWNMEGVKPTRRWNLLGGFDTVSENIYFHMGSWSSAEQMVDMAMNTLMKSDGHRRTILDPAHTHVGLGFAVDQHARRFYVDQTFVTRAGGEYFCPASARLGETVELRGRYDPARYSFEHIMVGYEEPPQERDRKWLNKSGSYSDAQDIVAGYCCQPNIRFRGMPTFHSVKADDAKGSFSAAVELDYKGKEGLYYLFAWLKDRETGREVLAATATVEVRN